MCDASDVLSNILHAPFKLDDLPLDPLRPATPLPDRSRTLQRTISCASIETIRPSNSKGIRRSINEIAENLKRKSATKKRQHSSTQDVPKNAARDRASDSKASLERKTVKRGRKTTSPLQESLHICEEKGVLAIADRLHSGVPSELDSPLTFSDCKPATMVNIRFFKDDEETWQDSSLPTRTLEPGAHVTMDHQCASQSPRTKIDLKDVQLDIRPSETDVTIWDGLQATHHVFKCRLLLRCTMHPYDSVSLPDIRLVEMNCNTRPAGSRYARPPVLQTAYEGAALGRVKNLGGLPNVNLAAGIHMDRLWCKIREEDGTWGWYRDALVPLSPRLFDKIEYREFKLASRVWVGESWVENELTFGISMLLRGVDMK